MLIFISILVFCQLVFMPVSGRPQSPEPDPPQWRRPLIENIRHSPPQPGQTEPVTEWTFHKTSDGQHPDGNEQQMVWLMNRARANPSAEGEWLAGLDNPDVVQAVTDLNVDLETMKAEFAAIPPKPPAAFDLRLYNAAYEHCQYLISCNCQSHSGQDTQVMNSGFEFGTLRGNVFSYAESAIHCHAALNIDWGASSDGTGMQPGRGHRVAIMSIDRNLYNVGIAMVPHEGSYPNVGPLVMTGNYASAKDFGYTIPPNHYNRFIVGTVWQDGDQNGIYDPGEGIGNVTVMPDHGTYYAVTGNSGGYSIPITEAGTFTVTFSGASLPAEGVVKQADVGNDSVLLDFNIADILDSDGDGTPDRLDECDSDPNKIYGGVCGCGIEDVDANDNGVIDCIEYPAPDIKINDSDETITLTPGTSLHVSVGLNPGIYAGQEADLWIKADTPFGEYCYRYPGRWIKGLKSVIDYPIPLQEFTGFSILDAPLPAGQYTFSFGIDLNADGNPDVDSPYADTIQANVQ